MTDLAIARDPATFSPIERMLLAPLPSEYHAEAVAAFLETFTAYERTEVLPYSWESLWARPSQLAPDGDDWDTWLLRAGRGVGKTRTVMEAVRRRVMAGQSRAVTIIGSTPADARDVMIEGPLSGLLAVHPKDCRPTYFPSKRLLTWPNGAIGHVRSGADPESIRGLQSDLVVGDEPASWAYGEEAWDNAMFGNRLGNPKAILCGTPKRRKWLRKLAQEPGTRLTTGSTYENMANLAPAFIRLVLGRYEGTRLGMQELHGRELDDVEGALFKMLWIPFAPLPDSWIKVNVGWDPAVTSKDKSDEHGIIVGGRAAESVVDTPLGPLQINANDVYVIDDLSGVMTPVEAACVCLRAAAKYGAVSVTIESNQGKETWESVWREAQRATGIMHVQLLAVTASKSKEERAIPLATAYERATAPDPPFRIFHAAKLPDQTVRSLEKLEEQMTTWVPAEDKKSKESPDRLDALVWCAHGLGIRAGGMGVRRAGSLSAL